MSRRTFIDVEATSIELRWFNVDESILFQRWNLVEIESWADVWLVSMLFQRWQNKVETTLKELRQFNVDESVLFQRWYLVENESWINVCSSALLRGWESSIETTLSIAALIGADVQQQVAKKQNKIKFSRVKHISFLHIRT